MLSVGIPKEVKSQERRVGLNPDAVGKLCQKGVKVFVEHNAGELSQYSDSDYLTAGATIVPDAKTLYAQAEIIQKVKEPQSTEFTYFKDGQILFCFLHLASQEQCELVRALVASRISALAFETLSVDGRLPMLGPMSQLAGGLSAIYAAYFRTLDLIQGHKIIYPPEFFSSLIETAMNYPSHLSYPALGKVMIFGGGIAGVQAADVARDIGADIVIVEKNESRRRVLGKDGLSCIAPDDLKLEVLSEADVLIGSAHSPGQRAVKVVDEKMFYEASEKHSKIVIDIAIDQGGNFPDAKSTSYDQPFYLDRAENLRFSVPNLPALCGRAASDALSEVSLPYTLALVQGLDKGLVAKPEIHSAINVRNGKILLESIRQAHQL